jgi:hypothetical protein
MKIAAGLPAMGIVPPSQRASTSHTTRVVGPRAFLEKNRRSRPRAGSEACAPFLISQAKSHPLVETER